MTPDDSIVVEAVLAGFGLLMVAIFVTGFQMRDQLRDIHTIVCDKRTGLAPMVDELKAAFKTMDDRVDSLERWRESQDEGEDA